MPKRAAAQQKRKRTRLSAELRQEQILEEATKFIAQRGYHGFSLQELAERCRITIAGLLYYFGSKDRLLIALLQHRVSRDTVALTWLRGESDTGKDSPLKSVVRSLHAIVERNVTQPEIVRFYAVMRAEALNRGHPAREFFISRETYHVRLYTKMLVVAHVPQPESTARQLLALMMGLEEQWLREDQSFDLLKEWDRGAAKLLPTR